jgi:hypothetical protein
MIRDLLYHIECPTAPAYTKYLTLSQEIDVLIAPVGDLVVVVATGDRRAGDQEQHFAQRVLHPCRLAPVADIPKMIQQKAQTILDERLFHDARLPSRTRPP